MKNNFEQLIQRVKSLPGSENVSGFARAIQMNQKTVDLYMKGERKPSLEFVQNICSAYDISADWLLGLKDNPSVDRGGVTNTATANGNGAQAAAGGSIQSSDEKTLSDIIRRIEALEGRQNSRRK